MDRCDVALPPGAVICAGCTTRARLDLGAVAGLLYELEVTSSGVGSSWQEPGSRGAHGELPMAINERAANARTALIHVVYGWVRVWAEETPPHPDRMPAVHALMASTGGQATLLASVRDLGSREWAALLATEIHGAVQEGDRATENPMPLLLVCTCTCGAEVMSVPDVKVARCRECGERWDVALSRALAVEAAQHLSAPAAVIARVLGPGVVTAAQIRGWAHRRSLAVDHVNEAGQPCYNLAAVAKLAREGAPTRDTTTETGDHVDAPTCANA